MSNFEHTEDKFSGKIGDLKLKKITSLSQQKIILNQKKIPQEIPDKNKSNNPAYIASKKVFLKNSKIEEKDRIFSDEKELMQKETLVIDSGLEIAKEMMILKALEIKGVDGVPRVFDSRSGFVKFKKASGGYIYTSGALEKIEGSTWLDYNFKNENELIDATIEAANILKNIYEKAGIIHNDVKPGNLMIRPDGHVMVIDFNAAEKAGTDGKISTYLGSPIYCAPEKVVHKMEKATCDIRSDIFSLTMTLAKKMNINFEMFTDEIASPEMKKDYFINALIEAMEKEKISEKLGHFIILNTDTDPIYRSQNYDQYLKGLKMVKDPTVDVDTLINFFRTDQGKKAVPQK